MKSYIFKKKAYKINSIHKDLNFTYNNKNPDVIECSCEYIKKAQNCAFFYSNKSECEPVLKAVNINSSLLIEYINSQSGCMWHSLKPFIVAN